VETTRHAAEILAPLHNDIEAHCLAKKCNFLVDHHLSFATLCCGKKSWKSSICHTPGITSHQPLRHGRDWLFPVLSLEKVKIHKR